MRSLQVDLGYTASSISLNDLESFIKPLHQAQEQLLKGSGDGSDYLGWLQLPERLDYYELGRLQATAEEVCAQSEVLLVVGIGGSYLGARAALEYLTSPYYNLHCGSQPQIFFVGNHLSAPMLHRVLQIVGERDFSVNVVSKSGNTAEPAIAFHLLRQLLEKRYGKEGARQRIVATTDAQHGSLRALVEEEGYASFAIPADVGGRYSLLTAAGLLPLFVAGIDVAELMNGALSMSQLLKNASLAENPAWQYVAARQSLWAKGKIIELFGSYEPAVRQLGEWWKQLFGESEGKQGKGIFPATLELTADLHSMGQYIQEGPRHLFSTILEIEKPCCDQQLQFAEAESLAHLSGLSLNEINRMVQSAACQAHSQGDAPSIVVRTPEATPYHLGELVFFFEFACALSGYVMGVNPFDQPGVEAYKQELNRLIRNR